MTLGRSWLLAARGLSLGLLTTAGTAVLSILLARFATGALLSLGAQPTGPGAVTQLETLLAGAVTGAGALVAAWYALSGAVGTCCTLARAAGGTWRAGELVLRRRGAPGVARLVGAGTGAVLTAGLVLAPAQAEPPEPTPEPTVAENLTWAVGEDDAAPGTADPPESSESASAEAPSEPSSASADASADAPPADGSTTSPPPPVTAARPSEATNSGEYQVQPGDTLWAIAAAHLDPEPSAARIATAWPAWYEANRSVIGPDPDLILPGTTLRQPD